MNLKSEAVGSQSGIEGHREAGCKVHHRVGVPHDQHKRSLILKDGPECLNGRIGIEVIERGVFHNEHLGAFLRQIISHAAGFVRQEYTGKIAAQIRGELTAGFYGFPGCVSKLLSAMFGQDEYLCHYPIPPFSFKISASLAAASSAPPPMISAPSPSGGMATSSTSILDPADPT